ncbi:hypothetical protein ASPACDRAFT_38190 [Aspergillus aculeatus ATCC 16872]|uniref:Uncharacterized protein n=1 Tax=Aspergillus aculeatus (strain ATCC 16872 / CBS 172.66 / WB 5094) TaxID=690307 RepID=A0A1L9X857_ASPA1|nr:uncharacterized protein ASPACDRAFT_38190 [Aspergillus aculeatus ATCC 16872]OJK04627.1 hypothetical protein ASPACDRAFT_38190 [Aspergillus aculeatus ATCC 16872]
MSGIDSGSQWSGGGSTGGSQDGSQGSWEGTDSSGSTSQAGGNASPSESIAASATTPTAADSFLTATQTTNPSPTTSTTTSSTSTSSASSSNGSNTETLAIAIPVAVAGAAIILGLLFFLRRRRRRVRGHVIPSTSQIDVITVPRQPILPQPQQNLPRSQPPQATPWGFTNASTHNIPFTGPIPYDTSNHSSDRLATSQPRGLNAPASQHSLTPGINTTLEQPPPYSRHPERAEAQVSPVTSAGVPSRQVSGRERPTSPFDHPLDDTVSEISRYSRGPSLVHRASLDEISSVSSIGDDERRPAMRH